MTVNELRAALEVFIKSGSANGRDDVRATMLRPTVLQQMAEAAYAAIPKWCVVKWSDGELEVVETLVAGSSKVRHHDGRMGRIMDICETKVDAMVREQNRREVAIKS